MGFTHDIENYDPVRGEQLEDYINRFKSLQCAIFYGEAPEEGAARPLRYTPERLSAIIRQQVPDYKYLPMNPDACSPELQERCLRYLLEQQYARKTVPNPYVARFPTQRKYQEIYTFADHMQNEIPQVMDAINAGDSRKVTTLVSEYLLEKLPEIKKALNDAKTPAQYFKVFEDWHEALQMGGVLNDIAKEDLADDKIDLTWRQTMEKMQASVQPFINIDGFLKDVVSSIAHPLSSLIDLNALLQQSPDVLNELEMPVAELAGGQQTVFADLGYAVTHRKTVVLNEVLEAVHAEKSRDCAIRATDGTVLPLDENNLTTAIDSGKPFFVVNMTLNDQDNVALVAVADKTRRTVLINNAIDPANVPAPQKPQDPGRWARLKDWFYRKTGQESKRDPAVVGYHVKLNEYKQQKEIVKNLTTIKDNMQKYIYAKDTVIRDVVSQMKHQTAEEWVADVQKQQKSRNAAKLSYEKAYKAIDHKQADIADSIELMNGEEPKADPETMNTLHLINNVVHTMQRAILNGRGMGEEEKIINAYATRLISKQLDENVNNILLHGKNYNLDPMLVQIANQNVGAENGNIKPELVMENKFKAFVKNEIVNNSNLKAAILSQAKNTNDALETLLDPNYPLKSVNLLKEITLQCHNSIGEKKEVKESVDLTKIYQEQPEAENGEPVHSFGNP